MANSCLTARGKYLLRGSPDSAMGEWIVQCIFLTCEALIGSGYGTDSAVSANVGELIGLLLNGWVSERFGYRYTVIGCLVLVIAWTAIFFTAQNVVALLVAEILCGIVREPSSEPMAGMLLTRFCSPGVYFKPYASPMPARFALLL